MYLPLQEVQETQVWSLAPEKAMAPHSSTLALKIPWAEEPGRLQSMGWLRVGHNWATSLSLITFYFHALEKEMATHSSVLAWRIPGVGKPGWLPSMGSHRVRNDWSDLAAQAVAAVHISEKAMAPHSSTLAWKIPWMEEPGRRRSMGRWGLDSTEWLHLGRSPGEGNSYQFQYSWLENAMDREAWQVIVHGVARSQTQLNRLSMHTLLCKYFLQSGLFFL